MRDFAGLVVAASLKLVVLSKFIYEIGGESMK